MPCKVKWTPSTPKSNPIPARFDPLPNQTDMKYAIKRHDGAIFPERYETMAEAQAELNYKLGNGGGYGLAWIIQITEN